MKSILIIIVSLTIVLAALPQSVYPESISACLNKDGVLNQACAKKLLKEKQLSMQMLYDELASELERHYQKAIDTPESYTPPPVEWYEKRIRLLTSAYDNFLSYKKQACTAAELEFKFGPKAMIHHYRCELNALEYFHETLLRIYRPEKRMLQKQIRQENDE